jgi:organic radical activating enzyme
MKLNTIYVTWNGEQNPFGIGSQTIFLRLQGCHIRCYEKTLGILCDTPEGLSQFGGEEVSALQILERLNTIREETGIDLICLTGGDPLWRKPTDLHELFGLLRSEGYQVTVETSGTLDWTQYYGYANMHFIVDYKLQSAGVKGNLVPKLADKMLSTDYIKFVVYDDSDYREMQLVLPQLALITEARMTAGVFWGGKMDTFQLFDRLKKDDLLRYLKGGINMQAHKLALSANYASNLPTER